MLCLFCFLLNLESLFPCYFAEKFTPWNKLDKFPAILSKTLYCECGPNFFKVLKIFKGLGLKKNINENEESLSVDINDWNYFAGETDHATATGVIFGLSILA